MKQLKSRAIKLASRHIDEKYEFMLKRGYEIVSLESVPAGWQATLRKSDLVVNLYRARGEDAVSFRTGAQAAEDFFDIESVVYAATGDKIPLTAYDDLSPVLQKYIDRIEAYFAQEYVKDPGALRQVQDAIWAASWAAYQQTLSRVETYHPQGPASVKVPKRLPVLYYPLKAVVLLLLFGALVTLYMVLLQSLFTALAPQTGMSIYFAAAGALLLAAGSMLLLRRWVKFIG